MQDQLELAAQDHVQMASVYLQGRRLHSFPGQPVPALGHPHCDKVFPEVQRDPLVFQFVPIASDPGMGYHCKEPGCILFTSSLQIFIYTDDVS